MSEPVLKVNNLSIDFLIDGIRTNAVRDVSFSLEKGKVLGIVGESGCGKSVTATSLLRLLPKDNSFIGEDTSIVLKGKDIHKINDKDFRKLRGKDMSMIFQEPMTSLNPVHKIGTQMIEMIQSHEKISRKDAFEKCVEMLEKVGIPEARSRMRAFPFELSGGMRQRVMIAMAILCNPDVLIADEPTTALDVTIQAQILELLGALKENLGMSIILITHDMGVVAEATDYVMVMYAGEMVEYGDIKEIFKNPLHPYTQGLLKSIPRPDVVETRLHTIEGTVPVLKNMPSGCRFADRCPFADAHCRENHPDVNTIGTHKVRCFKYKENANE